MWFRAAWIVGAIDKAPIIHEFRIKEISETFGTDLLEAQSQIEVGELTGAEAGRERPFAAGGNCGHG